ncbi:MAG: ribose 5-phosphate isomerase B [Anaerolineaceae bacterium]|jgi:ribose 5-phosphate isomerase B
MIIAVATDHGGFALKDAVIEAILAAGHQMLDLGAHDATSSDYPDFAEIAGRAMQQGKADRAILLCGSGVGISIAANKINGVYACVCHDTYTARQGVEHDGMNALCLGGRVVGTELAKEIVAAFLSATFHAEERHQRRTGKIKALEAYS